MLRSLEQNTTTTTTTTNNNNNKHKHRGQSRVCVPHRGRNARAVRVSVFSITCYVLRNKILLLLLLLLIIIIINTNIEGSLECVSPTEDETHVPYVFQCLVSRVTFFGT